MLHPPQFRASHSSSKSREFVDIQHISTAGSPVDAMRYRQQKVSNLTNPVLSHVEKLVRLWWHWPWKSLIVKDYDGKEHQQSAAYFTRDNCGKRTVHAVTFDKREELWEHWGQSCPYINAYIGKFSHLSIIPSKSGPEKKTLFAQLVGFCISNKTVQVFFASLDRCFWLFYFPLFLWENFSFPWLLFYSGDRHLSS